MENEWNSYEVECPPDVLCQFKRGMNGEIFIANRSDFRPEFNIAGLYWRLTGIGREQLDSVPVYQRQMRSIKMFPSLQEAMLQHASSALGSSLWGNAYGSGMLG